MTDNIHVLNLLISLVFAASVVYALDFLKKRFRKSSPPQKHRSSEEAKVFEESRWAVLNEPDPNMIKLKHRIMEICGDRAEDIRLSYYGDAVCSSPHSHGMSVKIENKEYVVQEVSRADEFITRTRSTERAAWLMCKPLFDPAYWHSKFEPSEAKNETSERR